MNPRNLFSLLPRDVKFGNCLTERVGSFITLLCCFGNFGRSSAHLPTLWCRTIHSLSPSDTWGTEQKHALSSCVCLRVASHGQMWPPLSQSWLVWGGQRWKDYSKPEYSLFTQSILNWILYVHRQGFEVILKKCTASEPERWRGRARRGYLW